MQENYSNFSMQEVLRLANSPAGRQLLAMLKGTDNATMQQAAQQVRSGDMEQAKATLSQLLGDPRVQQLLQELGRQK